MVLVSGLLPESNLLPSKRFGLPHRGLLSVPSDRIDAQARYLDYSDSATNLGDPLGLTRLPLALHGSIHRDIPSRHFAHKDSEGCFPSCSNTSACWDYHPPPCLIQSVRDVLLP